jgi:hypothetical protein
MIHSNIVRFTVWICRKFNSEEIEGIITQLTLTLKVPNAEVRPRDQFKEDHPNYKNSHKYQIIQIAPYGQSCHIRLTFIPRWQGPNSGYKKLVLFAFFSCSLILAEYYSLLVSPTLSFCSLWATQFSRR